MGVPAPRGGVHFHDGTPLTPADVVFSLDRTRGPNGFGQTNLENITRIEVTDGA